MFAGIEGEFVETGVAAGGSAASLLLAAAAAGAAPTLHLFDTFAGMPEPEAIDSPRAKEWVGKIAHTVEEVKQFMLGLGVPPGALVWHVGDVLKTPLQDLPCAVNLLRIDTDWSASYRWAFTHLWPRLAAGGVCLLDDYFDWEGAKAAVADFLAAPGNEGVVLHLSDPPILCKPLRDGSPGCRGLLDRLPIKG